MQRKMLKERMAATKSYLKFGTIRTGEISTKMTGFNFLKKTFKNHIHFLDTTRNTTVRRLGGYHF